MQSLTFSLKKNFKKLHFIIRSFVNSTSNGGRFINGYLQGGQSVKVLITLYINILHQIKQNLTWMSLVGTFIVLFNVRHQRSNFVHSFSVLFTLMLPIGTSCKRVKFINYATNYSDSFFQSIKSDRLLRLYWCMTHIFVVCLTGSYLV